MLCYQLKLGSPVYYRNELTVPLLVDFRQLWNTKQHNVLHLNLYTHSNTLLTLYHDNTVPQLTTNMNMIMWVMNYHHFNLW